AYRILRYIIGNDNRVTNFHFELCGDLLDEQTINLIKTARNGLFQFEIGIQSMNPETLRACNRSENVYPVLYNTGRLIEAGNCHVHVDLIAGLPCETMETFERGFDKVYALKAHAFQMGFLKVLKGTAMEAEAARYGIVYRDHAPYEVVSTADMSASDLILLKEMDRMLDTYYNRGGFTNTLNFFMSEITPFRFYKGLAEFYYENGYQNRERRKEDQYRILYAYARELERTGRIENCAEEALKTLDMDLRGTLDDINYNRFNKKGWEIKR
ncbi:MAG: DUF4080 domain-containing protein, partial [Firmicutes bacterium]|nr:DUF4080 domain-containing protein [Bacillota bacterium]